MIEQKNNYFVVIRVAALVIGVLLSMPLFANKNFISYAKYGEGTRCTAEGGKAGTCWDRTTHACGTYYDAGNYCPGDDSVQCCVDTNDYCNPPGLAGTCHNNRMQPASYPGGPNNGNIYACSGTWYTGAYCYGPGDVQCCVPPPAPPPASQPTATTVPQTPQPASTIFALDLFLHGIGKAGDSLNLGEAGGGNENPLHNTRKVLINVSKVTGTILVTKIGDVTYDPDSGSFKGNINMGTLADGTYEIRIKLTQSLEGVKTVDINGGEVNQIPQMSLVTGDINNDKTISSILDYNILLDCYSELKPAKSCSSQTKKDTADLDDDGKVNLSDLNLFLREITNLHTP